MQWHNTLKNIHKIKQNITKKQQIWNKINKDLMIPSDKLTVDTNSVPLSLKKHQYGCYPKESYIFREEFSVFIPQQTTTEIHITP